MIWEMFVTALGKAILLSILLLAGSVAIWAATWEEKDHSTTQEDSEQ